MNYLTIGKHDTVITTTYWNTLPDSHFSHLFEMNDIETRGYVPTFEEYVKIELMYPYMMFYNYIQKLDP